MKKLNLFLVCASVFFGMHASAQFILSNPQPCEGDTIKVFEQFPTSDGYCVGISPDYIPTTYYSYYINYGANFYTIVGGTPLNTLTTESSIRIKPYPSSYTLPAAMEIRVQRWKFRNDLSGLKDMCSEQTFFVTPRKNVTFSGPTTLDNPGIPSYSVTNVQEGVNFTWNMDPDWSIVNSNSNHSNVSISIDPTGGGPFPLNVTAVPDLNACGWPISKMISIAPCFYQGTTVFNFCTPQLNWGNILATTDFDDYPNKFPRMMGDFNGDDKDDLIGFGNTGVIVGLSTGSNFNYNTWTSSFTYGNEGYIQSLFPRMLGDFNGDGKDDIVGFATASTIVGLSNGSSFSTSGFASSPYFSYAEGFTGSNFPRFVGDFDGNGKDDIIGFGHNSTSVGLSMGNSFSVSGWDGGEFFSTTDGGFFDADKYPRMIGDFNGDGKDDVIGFGHANVLVGLSTVNSSGGNYFDVSTWTNAFTYGNDNILQSTTPRGIGDFNGDGKDDIILFGHTSVSVGISTGSGFDVSTWTTSDFTDTQGWSALRLGPLLEGPNVVIYDANGDGKDDIIGFNDGVYVAYSVGYGFQCADHDPDHFVLGAFGTPGYRGDKFAGNFDNRDDEAEFVGLTMDYVGVMDCDNCVTPVANAAMTGYYNMQPETAGPNTTDVYKYCTIDSLGLDLSATMCEDRYSIEIKPYDLSTGTSGAAVYQTGWIIQNAPQSIDLSAVPNLQTNQLYMITYSVGPTVNTKSFTFRITGLSSNFSITPHQTRSLATHFGTYTISQFCTNVISFGVNGLASGCYDDWRYEVIEVNAPLMVPNTNAIPIQQIPVGGGWNSGPITSQQISMSGIVLGKYYRIYLYVRKNGVTVSSSKIVERNSCTEDQTPPILHRSLSVDEKNGLGFDPVSILYPNPATNAIIINPAGYDEEQITGEIYDSYGKLVGNTTLETGKENTIDLLQLSPGMYLIKLQGNSRIEKLSFIKQ